MRDLLKDSPSMENAAQIIISKKSEIEKTASKTLRSDGCSYPVSSRLTVESFPDRMYGNFKFPKGSYTSYIIEIGSGKGHNWWCCLYPSLCFINQSSATFSDSSKDKLKRSLSKKEFKYATSDSNKKSVSNTKSKSDYNIKYRFKYLNKFREIKLFGKS
ncbi:MAG: stage II sporulation protein R [Lachnospiraceae bacterium]|nr:stage II sporulation protein R [Lachnospiraceae bacterium]